LPAKVDAMCIVKQTDSTLGKTLMAVVQLLTLLFLQLIAGTSAKRIAGGNYAKITDHPWQVSIQRINKKYPGQSFKESHFCGGSILDEYHIITAAHCFDDENFENKENWKKFTVWTGLDDLDELDEPVKQKSRHTIADYKHHTFYDTDDTDGDRYVYDLAILKLKEKISFTKFAKPICLASDAKTDRFGKDTVFTASGYGDTGHSGVLGNLQEVSLPYVDPVKCEQWYPELKTHHEGDWGICAGGKKGKKVCVGDSGGPLTWRDPEAPSSDPKLVGVTSYVWERLGKENKCHLSTVPDMFARISKMNGVWEEIEAKTKKKIDDKTGCLMPSQK